MDKLKILNICASSGNIGDDASHVGLKRILAKTLPKHSITKYDIRDFYMSEPRNERKIFDDKIFIKSTLDRHSGPAKFTIFGILLGLCIYASTKSITSLRLITDLSKG